MCSPKPKPWRLGTKGNTARPTCLLHLQHHRKHKLSGPPPCSLVWACSCPEDKEATQHPLLLFLPLPTFFCAEINTKSYTLELCWRKTQLSVPYIHDVPSPCGHSQQHPRVSGMLDTL